MRLFKEFARPARAAAAEPPRRSQPPSGKAFTAAAILRPPDPAAARRLLAGIYRFRGDEPAGAPEGGPPRSPWTMTPPSEDWLADLHGFDWLNDLAPFSDQGARRAAVITQGWLKRSRTAFPRSVKRARICAERLLNLCAHMATLRRLSDADASKRLDHALATDAKICGRGLSAREDETVLLCALALLRSAACVKTPDRSAAKAWDRLAGVIDAGQGLPAGRSDLALLTLAHLHDGAVMAKRKDAAALITRLEGGVEAIRHRDGTIARVGFAYGHAPETIDRVIGLSAGARRGRPSRCGPYRILRSAAARMIVECGERGASAHGLGAFEFGGAAPLVVNCGGHSRLLHGWRRALSSRAAWSRLVVTGREGAGGVETAWTDQMIDPGMVRETDGDAVLECDIRWSKAGGALRHVRRLALDTRDDGVRGRDVLLVEGKAPDVANERQTPCATARFHLHHQVKASLSRDGESVLLQSHKDEGWRFTAGGARVTLEPSLCVQGCEVKRSLQIVLRLDPGSSRDGRVLAEQEWTMTRCR